MSIDTTSYYDSLTTSSSTTAATTSSNSMSLDSEDFLTLLVTEMQYQDPTEPMDNSEMVNQLTQYSQLDELTNLNEKMDELVESLNAMTSSNGLDYLGKQIEASGRTLNVSDGVAGTLYYELADDAESLTVNLYNSSGSIVDTQIFSQLDAGTYTLNWGATDYDGEAADDGNYTAVFTATDADGDRVDVSTTTTGVVSGVSTTDDGVILILEDGRTVNMLDVTLATA